MKKKIIFITKALWIGGIETALVNMLDYFDYEKYDVTLLVLRAELDLLERVNKKCMVLIADRDKTITFQKPYLHNRLYHLTEETNNPSAFHQLMMWTIPAIRWLENRFYIRYIRDLMKNEKFDTAIIYSDVVGELAVRAIKAKKFLMFYHHGAMRHVYHDKIAYKKCEKIIAVSENQARLLRKYLPNNAHKIMVIHNLINISEIRSKSIMKISEHFDQTKFNIVSVGRISHEKGMDIAVRVCAKLVEDGFDNICWWIVGGGPDMQEVYDAIFETHMEKYVNIVGMKSNPYPYIRQADLYLQPSRFEAYGLTIMEALVLDIAVVSTNTLGAQEILQEGITGLLCPIEIKKLAKAVEILIKKPNQLEKMKKNIAVIDFEKQNRECINLLNQFL